MSMRASTNLGSIASALPKATSGAFVIFGAAEAFENSVDIGGTEAVKCQCEVRIELDRALKVFDSGVAIFLGDGTENEAGEEIASAQVLFVSRGVLCRRLGDAVLFSRAQFKSEASTIRCAISS